MPVLLRKVCLTLLALVLFAAAAPPVRADSFTFVVRTDMLNRIAAAAGPQTFSGTYDHHAPAWLGGHLIARISWTARIQNVTFTISTQGIRYTALVTMRFRAGSFLDVSRVQPVNGSASISIAGSELRFRMNNLNIPLAVNIPGAGLVTIHTISTTLPYRLTYRFNPQFALGTARTATSTDGCSA